MLTRASAIAQGDGLVFYGAGSNTTPQVRSYASTNSFGSAVGTVSGTQALVSVIKTSPTKQEAVAGYLDSSGNLQVMCYDGSTWSNEWTVAVGGTGTTRPFDIAYESNSGDVMVLYGNNGTGLGYRTKPGSSGCGTANWASASTFTPARTSGTIQWVKLAWDKRGSSNLIAAIWADAASDLSSQIWSGSAWGNEYTSALETSLEVVAAAQDVEDFDVEYESSSGDLMVVWAISTGANGTNGVRYSTCTGGTSSCTWSGKLTPATFADDATNLDISANPNTDEIVFASIGNGGNDMQAGYWSGSAWTNTADLDASAGTPLARTKLVATGWLINGSTTRSVIVYNDQSTTNIGYYTGNSGTFGTQSDFSPTPGFANPQKMYDIQTDPFNKERLMFSLSDNNGDLFAKRLSMTATPAFSWTNADGSAALETTLGQATVGDFSFAYWGYIPSRSYDQTAYRWYSNNDSVTPGTALAAESTAHTLASVGAPVRLRTQLSVATDALPAASQAFTLQYATSTSGPWSDIGFTGGDEWCDDTSGVTCTTSWGARAKITLNNSASAENLSNFPLLVKVNSSRIDYSKTQGTGQDIRFVDPSDPNTALPYEIEDWNESGDSYVWVKVPQIDSGSTSDYIWMYYDNASASDGQAVTSVWDSNFKGVWHSDETTGTTLADSTANTNNATKVSATSPNPGTGKIDTAQVYNGTSSRATAPDTASLDITGTLTVSTWVNASSVSGWRTIMCKDASFQPNYCLQTNGGTVDFSYYAGGGFVESTSVATLSTGTWYHITATYNDAANQVKIYINGALNSTTTQSTSLATTTSVLDIGHSAAGEWWSGTVDDIWLSDSVRSADWIEAEYISQSDAMNSYGSEEDQSSLMPAVWDFYDNTTPVSGATLSSGVLTGTDVSETYQESNPTTLNPGAVSVGQQAEWDFALDPSGASDGTTYYFRMVKSDGTALNTYTHYPQLTISIPTIPTLDQQMRGGQSVINGTKAPFSF